MRDEEETMNITQLKVKRRELELLVIGEIERRARKILREHHTLDEFIMGMGTAFFCYKERQFASGLTTCDDRKYMQPVLELIQEFDDLKITGHPMRFTADGETIRDW
jgi:hypothetical protein